MKNWRTGECTGKTTSKEDISWVIDWAWCTTFVLCKNRQTYSSFCTHPCFISKFDKLKKVWDIILERGVKVEYRQTLDNWPNWSLKKQRKNKLVDFLVENSQAQSVNQAKRKVYLLYISQNSLCIFLWINCCFCDSFSTVYWPRSLRKWWAH